MTGQSQSSDVLQHADRLLREVVPGTRGLWPRCCTWLLRIALEQALDDFWAATYPTVQNSSRRAQLLTLSRYLDPADARHVHQLWIDLSRASHHHAYELAPTSGELRRWHHEVAATVILLSPPTASTATENEAPTK